MNKSCQTCKNFDTATCMVCDTLLDDRWELCTKGQYTVDSLTGSFEEIFNDCLEDEETESDI